MSSAANETEEDAGKNPLAPVAGATTEEVSDEDYVDLVIGVGVGEG